MDVDTKAIRMRVKKFSSTDKYILGYCDKLWSEKLFYPSSILKYLEPFRVFQTLYFGLFFYYAPVSAYVYLLPGTSRGMTRERYSQGRKLGDEMPQNHALRKKRHVSKCSLWNAKRKVKDMINFHFLLSHFFAPPISNVKFSNIVKELEN